VWRPHQEQNVGTSKLVAKLLEHGALKGRRCGAKKTTTERSWYSGFYVATLQLGGRKKLASLGGSNRIDACGGGRVTMQLGPPTRNDVKQQELTATAKRTQPAPEGQVAYTSSQRTLHLSPPLGPGAPGRLPSKAALYYEINVAFRTGLRHIQHNSQYAALFTGTSSSRAAPTGRISSPVGDVSFIVGLRLSKQGADSA